MKTAEKHMIPSAKSSRRVFALENTRELVGEMFVDLHAQRVRSLSNAVTGVLHAAQLSVHCIGQAYAGVAEQADAEARREADPTHIRRADRRDRLLLIVAVAHTLLCLLGAAAEEAGIDRYLKANTVKRRTHSLYRQGLYWYTFMPTMRQEWFAPLIRAFDRIVKAHAFLAEFFGLAHDPAAYDKVEK